MFILIGYFKKIHKNEQKFSPVYFNLNGVTSVVLSETESGVDCVVEKSMMRTAEPVSSRFNIGHRVCSIEL